MATAALRQVRIRYEDAVCAIKAVANGDLPECRERIRHADRDLVFPGDLFVVKIKGEGGIHRWTDPFQDRTGPWEIKLLAQTKNCEYPWVRKKYKYSIEDDMNGTTQEWLAVLYDYEDEATFGTHFDTIENALRRVVRPRASTVTAVNRPNVALLQARRDEARYYDHVAASRLQRASVTAWEWQRIARLGSQHI